MTEPVSTPRPTSLRLIDAASAFDKYPNLRRPETRSATDSTVPAAPPAPNWLPEAAKAEWLRVAPLIQPWHEKFGDLLGVYACEIAAYKADPATFNSARLAQLRLCAVTLHLVPEIGQR